MVDCVCVDDFFDDFNWFLDNDLVDLRDVDCFVQHSVSGDNLGHLYHVVNYLLDLYSFLVDDFNGNFMSERNYNFFLFDFNGV